MSKLPTGPDGKRIVARVNGRPILEERFEEALTFAVRGQRRALTDEQTSIARAVIAKDILDTLIRDELVLEYAEKHGLKVSDAEVDAVIRQTNSTLGPGRKLEDQMIAQGRTLASLRAEVRSRVLRERVRQHIGREVLPASGETLAAAMRQMEAERQKYGLAETTAPEVRIRHLVIRAPADAPTTTVEAARKRAEMALKEVRGGRDFAEAVKKYSQDAYTKDLGGDLGFIQRGRTYPEFERAAFSMAPGETSEVIRTPVGFHIIQVTDRRADDLQSTYMRGERERLVNQHLEQAMREAKIERYF